MKKYLTLALITLTSICVVSCDEDYLSPDPSVSLTIDQAFSDPEIFQTYINGIYDEHGDSPYLTRLLPSQDVRGGDALLIPTNNFNRYVTEYQFIESPSNSYVSANLWFQAYDIIGLVNPALEALPDAEFEAGLKAGIEGELLTFRAVALHDLVRNFSQPYSAGRDNPGVVLNTEVLTGDDDPLGRSTVGEVYDQIVADLRRAADVMPAGYNDGSKITLRAVHGNLARVYLDMGEYALAAQYADLARQGISLMSATDWLAGFAAPTSEWIWWNGKTADDSNGFLSTHSFWDTRRLGYSSLRLDMTFVDNNFSPTDIRGVAALRVGSSGAPIVSTGYVSNKLQHNAGFVQDELIMRASEMYLISAEANARLGNTQAAQDALFAIQSRADVNAVRSGNTGQALIDEVLLERRKELYAEGHRYYDLQRLQLDLVRTTEGGHWSSVSGVIPFNDFRRISPIPQIELDANPIIRGEQNPGYGS